jgi:hypothetical protein
MGFGYTAGGRNLCFGRHYMVGQHSGLDKQHSAFGYVVRHLYFYGQKVWPGGTSYECRGIAKPFPLYGTQCDTFKNPEKNVSIFGNFCLVLPKLDW